MSGQLINWHSSALTVDCPKCSAKAGTRCVTLTTGRSTDTHADRWNAWTAAGRWRR